MWKLLAGFLGAMLISSVGFASAPISNLSEGQIEVGYGYEHFNTTFTPYYKIIHVSDSGNSNGFFVKAAITDKIILGISNDNVNTTRSINISGMGTISIDARSTSEDALFGEYYLNPNIKLLIQENFPDRNPYGNNSFSYGVEGKVNVSKNMDVFADIIRTNEINNNNSNNDSIGTIFAINKNTFLDISYGYSKDDYSTTNSVSGSIRYRF